MTDKRESVRVKDGQQMRVLDEAARRRRQRKALEALEEDNFSEDPHADLKMSKKAPKFDEGIDASGPGSKKKRKSRGDFKLRYRKTFGALLEEEHMLNKDGPTYFTACAPPSKLPERNFCAVLYLSFKLHMCSVWCTLLLYKMFRHTSGYEMSEVYSLTTE
ncbi:Zinc finger HIT domain-containing protein 1 [Bulinus truncatus]|nr:Zinc finger HIT domain-containing protein 1 [Bulinus truncatus]